MDVDGGDCDDPKALTGQSQLISPVSSLKAPSGPLVSSASTDFVWTTFGVSDLSFSAPYISQPCFSQKQVMLEDMDQPSNMT